MRRRGVATFFGLAILAIIVTGAVGAPVQSQKTAVSITIGYSDPNGVAASLRSIGIGAEKAIKALGLKWTVKPFDAQLSATKQVSDLDSMVSLKLGGIMSWTLDPGAADAAYKSAQAAGIPVIGLNSASKYFTTEIAGITDTTCIVAKQQAAYIASLVPHATVIAIGGPPVPSITLTTNCFLAAAKADGLQLLAHQDDPAASPSTNQQIMTT